MFIFLLICGVFGIWLSGWFIGVRVTVELLAEKIWIDDHNAVNTLVSAIAFIILPPFGLFFVLLDTLDELRTD